MKMLPPMMMFDKNQSFPLPGQCNQSCISTGGGEDIWQRGKHLGQHAEFILEQERPEFEKLKAASQWLCSGRWKISRTESRMETP